MDDVTSSAITIPKFNYDNKDYNTLVISTNGWVELQNISNNITSPNKGLISAFNLDLNKAPNGNPEIRYEQIGTEFVIQWQDMIKYAAFGTTEKLNFQVRINTNTNEIKIVYGPVSVVGAYNPIIGLRGIDNSNTAFRSVLSGGDWTSSLQGTVQSTSFIDNSTKPAVGLTYKWTPTYNVGQPSSVPTYSWSPATGLNNPNIANPIANPAVTTTYTLTVKDGSCSAIDMVTVNVSNQNNTVDTTIACGSSIMFNASGGISYSWNPTSGLNNPNIANPTCTPQYSSSYTVTITNPGATTKTGVMNVKTGTFAVDAGIDQTIVKNTSTTLNGASSGVVQMPYNGLNSGYVASSLTTGINYITGGSVFLNGSWDNHCSGQIPIPPFRFNNKVYNYIHVSSNGFIVFDINTPDPSQYNPLGANYEGVICAYQGDLVYNSNYTNSEVSYKQVGNEFVIQWRNTRRGWSFSSGFGDYTKYDLQIRLNTTTNQIAILGNLSFNVGIGAYSNTKTATNNVLLTPTDQPIYTWSPPTGLSNPNSLTPIATPTVTTTYTLTAKHGNCNAIDEVTIFVAEPRMFVNTSSVDNNQEILIDSTSLKVYPNPTHNDVMIDVLSPENQQAEISIVNLLGQTVYTENRAISEGITHQTIDCSAFEDGLYMIIVKTKDKILTEKLIKN